MAVSFTPTTVNNPTGAQGSYPLREAPGHEGMIADLQPYTCRSYRNQSGGPIPFGALVQTDNTPSSNDTFAIELATGSNLALIQGVAVSSLVHEFVGPQSGASYIPNPTPYAADGRIGYADGQTVNVVSDGVVWVWATEAISLGDAVRFWKVDNSGTVPGAFQGRWAKTAAVGKTIEIDSGARWLSETTGAGLVLLEINLPVMTFTADA